MLSRIIFIVILISSALSIASCSDDLHNASHPLYEPSPITQTQHLKSYTNIVYGYEFMYHEKYRLQDKHRFQDQQGGGRNIGFQRADNELLNSMVWVVGHNLDDKPLLEFGLDYFEGPVRPGTSGKYPTPTNNPVVSYHSVLSERYSFTTPSGISGYELYFVWEARDKERNVVSTIHSPPGPVFLFDISTPQESTALVFLGTYFKEDIDILSTFADSLRIVPKATS